jgi:hypothetical protein
MGIYDRDYMREGYDSKRRGKKTPSRRPRISLPHVIVALVLLGIVALFIVSLRTEEEEVQVVERVDYPLNINTASFEDLMTVPQIGPATAEQILKNRPFKELDDLLTIYGIGEAKLKVFSQYLTVAPPPPSTSPAATPE